MFSVDALRDHALTLGFDLCGVAPVADVARLDYLREWVGEGLRRATCTTSRAASRARHGPDACPSRRALGHRHRHHLPHRRAALDRAGRRRRGAHRALRVGRGLPRGARAPAAPADRLAQGTCRRAVRSRRLRRHGAGAGEGAGRRGGTRLDRQAHLPDQPGTRLVAVPLGDPHHARSSHRRAGRRTAAARARGASTSVRPGAIVEPYVVDATRCLSYITIESHAGHRRAGSASRWARRSTAATSARTSAPGTTVRPSPTTRSGWRVRSGAQATLAQLWRASDDELQVSIRHSPMYRTKVWRLRRNLALAIAASRDRRRRTPRCTRRATRRWTRRSPTRRRRARRRGRERGCDGYRSRPVPGIIDP